MGVCSWRHRLVLLGALLRVERAQLARPGGVALGRDLALRLGAELLEHGARVARDGHVHGAVVAELRRVDVHVDDLEVGGEARRPPELDDPVEARADGQDHVGLGEGLAPRVQEGQRVVLGDEAARDRRGVEGDAGRPPRRPGARRRRPTTRRRCPPMITGRSALARSAMASFTAPGSPRVRGAGRHGPGIVDLLLLDLLAQDVAGHVDVHRPGPARGGLAEGGVDDVGNALGVVDALRPLGDRASSPRPDRSPGRPPCRGTRAGSSRRWRPAARSRSRHWPRRWPG